MRGLTLSAMLSLTFAALISTAEAAPHSKADEPRGSSARLDTRSADEVPFTCGRQKLGSFLATLDPGVPHTIRVFGGCRENLVIRGFARLTLLAAHGASISDVSAGSAFVVQTERSSIVELQGFLIRGSVGCFEDSTCYFVADTFEGGEGVVVIRSYADFLEGSVIRNSIGHGLMVSNGSVARGDGLTIENAAANGVHLIGGAHLTLFSSTIRNNSNDGIRVRSHASLRVFDGTIQGNANNGIEVDSGSGAQLLASETGISVTGNGNAGVSIGDLSFVEFSDSLNITGNLGGTDVLCLPQFSATRGAQPDGFNGGSTNCVEP